MKKVINYKPSRATKVLLGLCPFVFLLIVYLMGSQARLAENPSDKLLPAFSQMGKTMHRMALEPSKRTGEIVFWQDTKSSLIRLITGVAIAAFIGLFVGLLTGALPVVSAWLSPY